MGGETDQWTPYLLRNTAPIFPWRDQPGYNMITGMADDAIDHLKQLNATAPDKPFFCYYVPGGNHAPHHPKKEWSDKFKGKFDTGWNAMREQIFENQKKLGVIPADTKLTPWPDGQAEFGGTKLPKWDTLTDDEKKLFARQAEVFAGYVAYTDHEIGRVIQAVEDMGKLTTRDHLPCTTAPAKAPRSALRGCGDSGCIPVRENEVLRRLGYRQDHSAYVGGWATFTHHRGPRSPLQRHPPGMCIAWPSIRTSACHQFTT